MRVVFLYPQWTGEYGLFGHFAKRNSTWPPLNIALLAAIVEQHGHEVIIVDAEAEGMNANELAQHALTLNPDIIALTCYSPFFHLSADVAQGLKQLKTKVPIVIGGTHITIKREEAFLPQFDYAFVGESEKSFAEFLDTFAKKGDLTKVKGFFYREGDQVKYTGDPDPLTTEVAKGSELGNNSYPLDKFPFPARHLLNMKRYRLGTMHGRKFFTSIQTMRGCPWACIFCASKELQTQRVVMRSPRSVVNEMMSVVEKYPFLNHFYIVDDVLTLWKDHVVEMCDLINKEKLKITFEGSTRANLVDDELVKYLAESGLIRLSFGLETVDTEMRATMKKKVPLEFYSQANKICEKHKVEAMNSVMIGLPGETRETVRKTLTWLRNAREVKQANFAIAIPYPGTEFNDIATSGQHGVQLLSKDFSKYLRYGNAVTQIGDLTSKDLIELQNEGFVSIYSAPWRWKPMFQKHGVIGALLMLVRVARLYIQKSLRIFMPFRVHPGLP